MARLWGNSILEVNVKYLGCYYCGNVIRDKTRFKIKRIEEHVFVFCSKLCEKIWDKKNSG